MIKLKLSVINYLYLFFVVIYSGYSLSFFRGDLGTFSLFIISLILFRINKLNLDRNISYLLGVWLVYCLLMMVYGGVFFPGFLLRHVNYFLVAYILINIYSRDIFTKYVDVVYKLAFISLVFFTWQLISYDSISAVFRVIDLAGYSQSIIESHAPTKSIGIYSVHGHPLVHTRNAGFAWEPGPYSIFLTAALYLVISTTKDIFKNPVFWVLLIALFTTQSTTGIGIFLALVGYTYLVNVKWTFSRIAFASIGMLAFVYLFFNLDFLYPKIAALMLAGDADSIIGRSEQLEGLRTVSLGRFAALEVGYIEFIRNPILGYAGASKLSYASEMDLNVNIVTGIATIFGMYGILWVFAAGIILFKSSKKIADVLENKSTLAFVILFAGALFGFHAQTFVILYVFLLFGLFYRSDEYSGGIFYIHKSLLNR